jgi:hypothetical protein
MNMKSNFETEEMKMKMKMEKRNRNMNVTEAWESVVGKFRDLKVKECMELMGLNYGQIYSARYGDIFKSQLQAKNVNYSKFYMTNK